VRCALFAESLPLLLVCRYWSGRDGSPQPSDEWCVVEKTHGTSQRQPMHLPTSIHAH
jgi:hypothetical protein